MLKLTVAIATVTGMMTLSALMVAEMSGEQSKEGKVSKELSDLQFNSRVRNPPELANPHILRAIKALGPLYKGISPDKSRPLGATGRAPTLLGS